MYSVFVKLFRVPTRRKGNHFLVVHTYLYQCETSASISETGVENGLPVLFRLLLTRNHLIFGKFNFYAKSSLSGVFLSRYESVIFHGQFTFYTLEPESRYEVLVQARNELGWSDQGQTFTFSTPRSVISFNPIWGPKTPKMAAKQTPNFVTFPISIWPIWKAKKIGFSQWFWELSRGWCWPSPPLNVYFQPNCK